MSNADVFIMIPVYGRFQPVKKEPVGDIKEFLIQMKETSYYECSHRMSDSLERYYLGSAEIAYTDDEYDMDKAEWIPAELILTYQSVTQLGILQMIFTGFNKDRTQIGDIVSTEHLQMRLNKKIYTLDGYLRQMHHMNRCGKSRCVYCLPLTAKDNTELEYLLAGESGNSEHASYNIENDNICEKAQNDISVYDFYELYASQSSLVYYTRDFVEKFIENIDEEVLLIFICEIAILKNTAIARINNQIIDELMENSDISTKRTLQLYVEFGKTIMLWENNVYNYENVQILSNNINEAFGTAELLEEYQRNKDHLEQIASLRSSIASEREGKVLNVLAFILSIAELIQFAQIVISWIMENPDLYYWIGGGIGTTVVLFLLLYYRARKRKRQRRKY